MTTRTSLLALMFLLAACGQDPTDPQPTMACIKIGEPTYGGRAGPIYPCLQYGITCPQPMKLVSRKSGEGNDKLACRLQDEKP